MYLTTDRRARRCLRPALLCGVLLMWPQLGLSLPPSEASDAELAQMRGRGIVGGTPVYFGVELVTRWQNSDGAVIDGAVRMAMGQDLHPTVTVISSAANAGSPPASAHDVVIASGGLDQADGVVQSIQIGSDGNAVQQDISIDMDHGGSAPPAAEGVAVALGGSYVEGATTVSFDATGLSLRVQVPGHGSVLQQIRRGQGLLQSTLLEGDRNRIHNSIRIDAILPEALGRNPLTGHPAFDSLRFLRPAGTY